MAQHAMLRYHTEARAAGETLSAEGGRVFAVDALAVVRRFLILGSTGTFYATGFDVTRMATDQVDAAIGADPAAVLDLAIEVHEKNLALRRDPLLYTLARLTCPDVPQPTRGRAARRVADIARTGTDLLHWISYRVPMGVPRVTTDPDGTQRETRGYSTTLFKLAIKQWFLSRTPDDLALQAVKYDQRDGYTMRDALRMGRPTAPSAAYAAVFDWMTHPDIRTQPAWIMRDDVQGKVRDLFLGYAGLRQGRDLTIDVDAVREYRLPREAVPGELLQQPEVWRALLADMPSMALIRNLGKLGSLGLLDDKEVRGNVLARISRAAGKLHPFHFFIASRVYAQGHGVRGSLSWTPHEAITDELMQAFGVAFGHLPVNLDRRPLIALDFSSSMYQAAAGTVVTCVEAETALAMVLAHQYPRAEFCAFSDMIVPIQVHGRSFQSVYNQVFAKSGGGTFCSLPLQIAHGSTHITDVVAITDLQTWWQRQSPADIVRTIHRQEGREGFRFAVLAMATNDISLADPNDPLQMNLVGMSADVPVVLSSFLNGEL